MLPRMAPSSPPVMRTLHLLKTPDILCANDSRLPVSYIVVNTSMSFSGSVHKHMQFRQSGICDGGRGILKVTDIGHDSMRFGACNRTWKVSPSAPLRKAWVCRVLTIDRR